MWNGFLFLGALLIAAAPLLADERDECERLASKYNARVEVTLSDGSRCDLLSKEYAIEVDWAKKWPEGIGQSLLYAELTGRKPALILLIRDAEKEARYTKRAQLVADRAEITLFLEDVE